jgi:hypothetical protein
LFYKVRTAQQWLLREALLPLIGGDAVDVEVHSSAKHESGAEQLEHAILAVDQAVRAADQAVRTARRTTDESVIVAVGEAVKASAQAVAASRSASATEAAQTVGKVAIASSMARPGVASRGRETLTKVATALRGSAVAGLAVAFFVPFPLLVGIGATAGFFGGAILASKDSAAPGESQPESKDPRSR